MTSLRLNLLHVGLLTALFAGPATAAPAMSHAELWDLREVRRHPLALESVATPRRVPLAVATKEDWMNRGDAWVAPRATGEEKTPAPGAALDKSAELVVEELYLTAGVTPVGPNRIYCAVARPAQATGPVPVRPLIRGELDRALQNSGILQWLQAVQSMAGGHQDGMGHFMKTCPPTDHCPCMPPPSAPPK